MAQTVAVVRATLPSAAVGNTVDFTKSGFGTPTAAILVACNGNSTNNPQTNSDISIGFWDGTNQRTVGTGELDAADVTAPVRSSNDAYGILANMASATPTAYTISAITDGIRLTLSVDTTGVDRFCTVLLIAGVSAKVLTFIPDAIQDATEESASLGFAPKLIFFTSIGSNVVDDPGSAAGTITFGFAESSGNVHRMLAYASDGGLADATLTLQYSETRCTGQAFNGGLNWSAEVTAFGSDTFTTTSRDGAPTGDVCFVLALGGADLSYDVGTLTTPTATGNDVVATDVSPDALLLMLSTATGTTIHADSNANGIMVGMADADGEFAHNISTEDGAATTNANSAASAAAIVNLDSSSGGSMTDMCDATAVLNSADFTLSYSATNGTARKGWWVAFGASNVVAETATLRVATSGMQW
jgi:hypothetical protein